MTDQSPRLTPNEFTELLSKRKGAIQTRSAKIVALPSTSDYQEDYDRARILLEASADPDHESRAYTIIRKVQSGKRLTPEERSYEITDLEELHGTLLPTLDWQYRRREDQYRAKRSIKSLNEQIDYCIELLFKKKVTLSELPSDFNWCENNKIELIYNEPGKEQFFKRLFDDIRTAKHHIQMVMFGMKGKVGNENDIAWHMAKILAEKARAGVMVNLLIDAKGCGLSWLGHLPEGVALMDWLRSQGVNVVVNHPLKPYDLQRFLRFDHRKIYVIDGKIGYCGGIGVENKFFSDCYDVMLRLEGEIVYQLQIHFLSTFHWQGGTVMRPNQSKQEIRQRFFPELNHQIGNQRAKLLANMPATGQRAISDTYVKALERTNKSFYFMNPYCFTDWLVNKLQLLAERLYKNGYAWRPGMADPAGVAAMFPGAGYDFPMDQARKHEYDNLRYAGVGIMIYPGMLHGKVYVQDAQICNVGSFNIDDASLERNWETNILIENHEFANKVTKELFTNKESNVEIKVASELKVSKLELMKQNLADVIDFVI